MRVRVDDVSLWTKALVPSIFCLKIRDKRCSTGFQILNVSRVQELSPVVFWGQFFQWWDCWLKVPWRVLSGRKCSSSTDQERILFHPFLLPSPSPFSPSPAWRWIWRHFFCEGFLSLPHLGRSRMFCAGAHWEEIPSGSGSRVAVARGTHSTGICRGSGSSKQFLIHDASHRKCSWKNSNYSPVKNIHLEMEFMGVPKSLLATTCHVNLL